MPPEWDGKERRLEDERRKICYLHKEQIEQIKTDIEDNQKAIHDIETVKIPACETFRGQVKVVGVIAGLVWSLGFMYTFNHKTVSLAEFDKVHEMIDRNHEAIFDIRGDYKAMLVEVRNLVKEVERSNNLTEKVIMIVAKQSVEEKELINDGPR